MFDRHTLEERMMEHLYGEMSGEDSARYEEALQSHPDIRARIEEYRSIRGMLARAPRLQVPGKVSANVLAEAARSLEGSPTFWQRLAALFRQPSFAAVAVALLVVVAGVWLLRGPGLLLRSERQAVQERTAGPAALPAQTAAQAPAPAAGEKAAETPVARAPASPEPSPEMPAQEAGDMSRRGLAPGFAEGEAVAAGGVKPPVVSGPAPAPKLAYRALEAGKKATEEKAEQEAEATALLSGEAYGPAREAQAPAGSAGAVMWKEMGDDRLGLGGEDKGGGGRSEGAGSAAMAADSLKAKAASSEAPAPGAEQAGAPASGLRATTRDGSIATKLQGQPAAFADLEARPAAPVAPAATLPAVTSTARPAPVPAAPPAPRAMPRDEAARPLAEEAPEEPDLAEESREAEERRRASGDDLDAARGAMRAARYGDARRLLEEALDRPLQPSQAFEARWNIAATYEKEYDWAGALNGYERLLAAHPQSPRRGEILLHMASLWVKMGNRDKARQILESLQGDSMVGGLARARLQELRQPPAGATAPAKAAPAADEVPAAAPAEKSK